MEKQNLNQNSPITAEMQKLKLLEGQIAKKVSPLLLDYLFIFAPDIVYDLNIKTVNPTVSSILTNYIRSSDALLTKLGIATQPKKGNPLEDFLISIHDIYLLRYVDAKAIYAEYELYRIPTQFEVKLNELSHKTIADYSTMISFKVPDGLIIDESGDIDWKQTIQQEKSEHKLARYVSAYKKATMFSKQMFIDLQAITTKGLAYPIFRKELTQLTEDVIMQAVFYFTADVHKYIDKSYSLQDSLTNVYAYYKEISAKGNTNIMGTLNQFFNEIRTTILTTLNSLKDLNPDTRAAILDDYLELLIAYIKTNLLLPKDYYSVTLRDDTQFYESEQDNNYQQLLDFYLYIPEGGMTETPIETFNVDFSREAKFFIFQAVVGDNQNPQLTLKSYLGE